jgi:biopolymer transport protein ExbB/TolQ
MNKHLLSFLVLLGFIVIIQSAYTFWINPEVEQLVRVSNETGQILPRNFFVVVKDYQQKVCIILFLWALFLCVEKYLRLSNQNYLFDIDILQNDSGVLDGEHSSDLLSSLENLPESVKSSPLIEIVASSLRRYAITQSIQSAADAIEPALDAMAVKNESELTIVKYISWAIPAIGFLGTVDGIGQAMAQAELATQGNIGPMTTSLGLAFNSTFVALMVSIVLMMAISIIQREQADNLVRVQDYCERYLIRKITVHKPGPLTPDP